jgi:CMP-N,N'-diacetyllegionaminic acid synthase
MKLLCSICMRSGSKGVPNKNIRNLCGKPLLSYTIEQAVSTNLFQHIVVSTDSDIIGTAALKVGADAWFLRPPELATDSAAKIPAIRHLFQVAEKHYQSMFDVLIDLDVTSPLRMPDDIVNAYRRFIEENAEILITVTPSRRNPYFNMVEIRNGVIHTVKETHERLFCRQDAPKVFDMNASIYIWKRDAILTRDDLFGDRTSMYEMPEGRSIDIDSEEDWNYIEYKMAQAHGVAY